MHTLDVLHVFQEETRLLTNREEALGLLMAHLLSRSPLASLAKRLAPLPVLLRRV